jgi:hypothetical protein
MRPLLRLACLGSLSAVSVTLFLGPAPAGAGGPSSIVGSWQGQGSATPTATAGVFNVTDNGVGVATHVGAFVLVSSEVDSFLTGGISDGMCTLTTPSGDTIVATYGGSLALTGPTSIAFTSPGQIIGGTGRFQSATGTIVFKGTADTTSARIIGTFVASLVSVR